MVESAQVIPPFSASECSEWQPKSDGGSCARSRNAFEAAANLLQPCAHVIQTMATLFNRMEAPSVVLDLHNQLAGDLQAENDLSRARVAYDVRQGFANAERELMT